MAFLHDGRKKVRKGLAWKQTYCILTMKLWIYGIHIFELRNKEINVKKILAVINATYAVAKRKPEKIRLAGIRTLTSAIPDGAAL